MPTIGLQGTRPLTQSRSATSLHAILTPYIRLLKNQMFDVEFKREIDRSIEGQICTISAEATVDTIPISQIRELLCSTKSGSAPGEDCISYDVLKQCSDISLQKMCDLINQCLKENIFPRAWKSAK